MVYAALFILCVALNSPTPYSTNIPNAIPFGACIPSGIVLAALPKEAFGKIELKTRIALALGTCTVMDGEGRCRKEGDMVVEMR